MRIPGDIIFENSYVLALTVIPYTLTLRTDFALTPEHPLYTPQECYVKGTMSIAGFEKLTWETTGAKPSIDANGESDYGSLDEFAHEDGRWRLACEAGVIELVGG